MKRFDRTVPGGFIILAGLILLAVLAWPSEGWSRTARRACNVTADVDALLKNWAEKLSQSTPSNPRPIVETYEPRNAVLLPTCSGETAIGRGQITEYFKEFLDYKPTVKFTTRAIGGDCTIAFASGTYTFTLGNLANQELLARYTYVFERRNTKWLIAQHHSSLVPKLTPEQKCPSKD